MPKITRLSDNCTGHPDGFPPRPSISSSPNVFINGLGVVRVGDKYAIHCNAIPVCHDGTLIVGSPNLYCNGRPVGRIGDAIDCSSNVGQGSPDTFNGSGGPNDIANAQALITAVGTVGIADELDTASHHEVPDVYPPTIQQTPPPPIPPGEITEEDNTTPPPATTPPIGCPVVDPQNIDYDLQLSTNVKLRDLTIDATFPHSLRAQRGLTIEEIVCNLKGLAENIIEPFIAHFGSGFAFNSGFRTVQNGKSQHEVGMAVDLQKSGFSESDYWNGALWIKDNLPYDQFIFEKGNSFWYHISYNRTAGTQRGQVLTMKGGNYSSGLKRG